MSFSEPTTTSLIKKQLRHKFVAYPSVIGSLLFIQLLAIALFSSTNFGVNNLTSTGNSFVETSSDVYFAFTAMWAFSMGVRVTLRAYREQAFTFVATNFTHNMSNLLLVCIATAIGAFTMLLAGNIQRFIHLLENDYVILHAVSPLSNPLDFMTMWITGLLYLWLFAAVGYTLGSLAQRWKFAVPLLILIIVFGPAVWNITRNSIFFDQLPQFAQHLFEINLLVEAVQFYGAETSFLLFFMKVIVTLSILLAASIRLTNYVEVRK